MVVHEKHGCEMSLQYYCIMPYVVQDILFNTIEWVGSPRRSLPTDVIKTINLNVFLCVNVHNVPINTLDVSTASALSIDRC